MDLIPDKFLEEMKKSGRGHLHEVRSMADELLRRRAGEDVRNNAHREILRLEYLRQRVEDIGNYRIPSVAIPPLELGNSTYVKFQGGLAPIYCIVYRVR